LSAIVSGDGRAVTVVANGYEAIAEFQRKRYDLVLLDVMMPGIDGLATLAQLRSLTPPGEHVPIVLITALDARADRLRGLGAGADDFLPKPVDANEVRCRVRTFLALRDAQLALKERAEQLERVQQAKAELAAMIVHDLKNPLAAIAGNVKWIATRWHAPENAPLIADALDDVTASTHRLVGLVTTLIDVEKAESGLLSIERRPTNLADLLGSVAHEHRKEAEERSISLLVQAGPPSPALIDATLMTRALENLLLNALRYAGTGGSIAVGARSVDTFLEVFIGNTGRPIPPDQRERLFQKYATTERRSRGDNLGLGLYFCRLVAEGHGGTISARSTNAWPTEFVMRLPQ
jgi:signal transduction histidine kinase